MRRLPLPTALAACLLAVCVLAACQQEQPTPTTAGDTQPAKAAAPLPTAAEAKALIESSAELGEFEFTNASFTVPVAGSAMSEPARASARELAAAGWVAFDGAGDIQLTEKARNDKRFLLRANGILDVVPLAKKQMGDVTAVRANPDNTASADFAWRWIPNELGAAFRTGDLATRFSASRTARATLIWDGSKWSVLSIESAGGTP